MLEAAKGMPGLIAEIEGGVLASDAACILILPKNA